MVRVFRGATALLAAAFLTMLAVPTKAHAGGSICGNGSIEFGEGCDDGDSTSGNGCSSSCLVEYEFPCNTGGPGLTGDASCETGLCDSTEIPPTCEQPGVCGNGLLESGEGCDDGGNDNGDGCNSSCLVEDTFPCNSDGAGATGDASCSSGICDEEISTCMEPLTCPNTVCEPSASETCASCPQDCGTCEPTTTTTSTTTTTTSTTTTTTSTTTSSSTTLPPTGACCTDSGCTDNTSQQYCGVELGGSWAGADTTCAEGACSVCGNGCVEAGEQCDDGDSESTDGCDSNCQEEQCWQCGVLQGGVATSTTMPIPPACQPSFCFHIDGCGVCGDGELNNGEQCDDGNTTSGANDCCSATCQYVTGGTSCADATFCDGPETCDGSGQCNAGSPPDCSSFTTECTTGVCDEEVHCHADSTQKNGQACDASGSCVVGGSGTCSNGVCSGAGTVLSPTCRWIIVGGSPTGDVRVRTGAGSSLDANTCGDTAKWAGATSASMVSVATMGEGARFYGSPVVDGDIVTGGSTVKSNIYLTIPGTTTKFIDTETTVAKTPLGVVDTTADHALVAVCNTDQGLLQAAVPFIQSIGDGMLEDGSPFGGLRVKIGESHTIDITGQGVADYDVKGLKVGKHATLTLKGTASDVLVLRVDGRMKIGYGATVVLDGLVPEHVLFYGFGTGSRCRVSPGATGSGTIFCPTTRRFVVGVGSTWSGTFLGAGREVQVRVGAQLTHVPFTGF